jgi:hypothetical protein
MTKLSSQSSTGIRQPRMSSIGRSMGALALTFVLVLAGGGCVSTPVETTQAPVIVGTPSPVAVLMDRLPTNNSEAPDDIVFTPGGSAYRANVHQQGVTDKWPSIDTVETRLVSGSDAIFVRYFSNVTTKSGEIRNNLLYVRKEGGHFERETISLYTVGAPSDIQFLQGAAGG